MREATNSSENVHALRSSIMLLLTTFVASAKNPKDSEMLGALAACFCDALIINGTPLSDEVLESIRKTYDLCRERARNGRKGGCNCPMIDNLGWARLCLVSQQEK